MKKHLTLKNLPSSEQPYEKCLSYGTERLSDAELIAVIIRTGTRSERAVDLAMNLLQHSKVSEGLISLNYLTLKDLMSIRGIGKVKAIQILCMVELTKRMSKAINKDCVQFTNPKTVANYYMEEMRHLTTEQIKLVMMDSKSKIIKDMMISKGTVNASILAPREIFIHALEYEAVNIILLHNHPSGDPSPSKEDLQTTQRVKDAGNLIGIKLMDHIIIGDNRYVSLKEQGII